MSILILKKRDFCDVLKRKYNLAKMAAYYVLYFTATGVSLMSGMISYLVKQAMDSTLTTGKATKVKINSIGYFGFVLLGLEFLGFALGAALPLYSLTGKSYYKECGQYLKPKKIFYHWVPQMR